MKSLLLALSGFCLLASTAHAQQLLLPTDNRALFDQPSSFFQFVDRDFEGAKTTPWEGGQFGFVRDPRRFGSRIAYARFHEGLDIKPLQRDAKGNPLDEVRAIADGIVAYSTVSPGLSNYGRYIVVKHDWNEGSFYSLYAHLAEPRVAVGQKVKAGTMLGVLGYTGSGIDQRRAHVHVELNLFLSRRFEAWHAASFATPNHHGVFNGLNLIGLDLQALYLAQKKNPAVTAAGAVRATESGYRVAVPGDAEMEIVKNYPWLLDGARPTGKPVSWEVTFSRWGLPLAVKTSNTPVSQPVVTWVKDAGIPHYTHTRGCVTGSGSTGKLTTEGLRFVKLVCGWF
ncbi:MAG: M23 family metallopeptidase [Prosthecobacter sp.]|jgi:murein DD-endopeptidase MepM/ murein hydrolase activator NlpD|uniref:murein hydrolase activator EnvC family protein n=1 Tax=Prosthecobacter sp. TaxID=1965333 RepID=UPI0019DB3088|nr:M23 family metallopeptidase [Prosthecobacter sp.]MBE2286445.1 M23 family metallopeptidase [Prosthecobacter sp.]